MKQEMESIKSDNEKLMIEHKSYVSKNASLTEQLNNLELQNYILTMEKVDFELGRNMVTQAKAELDKTKAELDKTKAELDQTKAELDQTKAELDKFKEFLMQKHTKLNKAEETEKDLLESLKQKSSELNKTNIAEGHLHIELNSLQRELSVSKEKFKEHLIKFKQQFEELHDEYLTCRKDRDRYSVIKALFHQVLKKDEKFCQTNIDSEFTSDDDLFEMLEALIREAFEDKKNHYEETSKSYTLICGLNEADKKKNIMLRNLQLQNAYLEVSENNMKSELEKCKDNAKIEIAKRDEITNTLRDELEELDKICSNVMLKVEETTEKEKKISELQKQLNLNEEKIKDIEDLKCELAEMETLAKNLNMKNEVLINKDKKAIEEIFNLKVAIAQKSEGQEKANFKLQEKYSWLIRIQKESVAFIERQKSEIKERDDLIEMLEREIISLKPLSLS